MVQIRITDISGGSYPIEVYIADVYGNYQTYIGTISPGPVPPTQTYNSTIPSIFQTAPQLMLKLIDSNGCEIFKILNCDFGCAFDITIELASCVVNINIMETTCEVSVDVTKSS